MATPTPNLENALRYLTSKHRVQSTLILRRDTGVIIHVDGVIAAGEPSNPSLDTNATSTSDAPVRQASSDGLGSAEQPQPALSNGQLAPTRAQQLASMALRFTAVAGDLATTLEREGDDKEKVGLLRMRTGKHEIIVVPDERFLLVVVSDAGA